MTEEMLYDTYLVLEEMGSKPEEIFYGSVEEMEGKQGQK
jgi:hypothetical protein